MTESASSAMSPDRANPRTITVREVGVNANRDRDCGVSSALDSAISGIRRSDSQRALLQGTEAEPEECCDQHSRARRYWWVPIAVTALVACTWAWSIKSGDSPTLNRAEQALEQALDTVEHNLTDQTKQRLRHANQAVDQAVETLRDNPMWDLFKDDGTSTNTTTTLTTTTSSSTTATVTTTTSTVTTGPASVVEFYMYRAQDDANYTLENVNTADLAGVLWYLHNEVMVLCPRKYSIVRVRRLKVTALKPFAPFVAFDKGRCTAGTCEDVWMKYGFRVGCQKLFSAYSEDGHWFSLPGRCPAKEYSEKTDACKEAKPGSWLAGGGCDLDSVKKRKGQCSWHVEDAGEVRIDEVTGISKYFPDYGTFCARGGHEYDKPQDKGVLLNFWDGFTDKDKCAWRLQQFQDAFKTKYPTMPADLPPPPWC